MEECSLHFISFNLEQIDQLVFLVGEGLFFRTPETIYFRQSESIYFVPQKSILQCYLALYASLTSVYV